MIAVTTNIESMEFRRYQNAEIGYEEHPRTGTTDDVEAIIPFLHRMLGVVFIEAVQGCVEASSQAGRCL